MEIQENVVTLPEAGMCLKLYMQELELAFIKEALKRSQGVKAHAAKILGMNRVTLFCKMRKYGLTAEPGRDALAGQ